jgi:hypothetical protein
MRLVRQLKGSWQYRLNQSEADILLGLVKRFPFTEMHPAKISRSDPSPQAFEREKLLLESLAEHRKKLQQQAASLLGGEKWKQAGKDHWLTLDAASREMLLQLLNDIRIGCWHAVGAPETLDLPTLHDSANNLGYRQLMELAGYFEMSLLEPET